MKKINYIIVLLVILFIGGCTERIDIELDSTYTRFVVEGYVSDETKAHWVKLSKSVDYYYPTSAPTISGASVKFIVDEGDTTIILTESNHSDSAGYYKTYPNYTGKVGSIYQLEIELPEEINGEKNYTASCELLPVPPIDSLAIIDSVYWDIEYWEVQLFAQEPPETEDFYTFHVYQFNRNRKFNKTLTYPLNNLGITSDLGINGSYINGVGIYYFFDDEDYGDILYEGDTIVVGMGGVTEEYYNFIYEFQIETNDFSNPLFDGPPANISTNISNEALGFFAAYSISYDTIIYVE